MSQGYSGSFAINGVNLTLPPSDGGWIVRDTLGRDGNNRPIYPAIREFEMRWNLISSADLQQIINAQLASVTGSIVSDLPQWGASDYLFYRYSGTIWNEVTVGHYFVGYTTDVTLVISNVRTN